MLANEGRESAKPNVKSYLRVRRHGSQQFDLMVDRIAHGNRRSRTREGRDWCRLCRMSSSPLPNPPGEVNAGLREMLAGFRPHRVSPMFDECDCMRGIRLSLNCIMVLASSACPAKERHQVLAYPPASVDDAVRFVRIHAELGAVGSSLPGPCPIPRALPGLSRRERRSVGARTRLHSTDRSLSMYASIDL